MMPLRRTDGPLFEYACHEGNIGMARHHGRRAAQGHAGRDIGSVTPVR